MARIWYPSIGFPFESRHIMAPAFGANRYGISLALVAVRQCVLWIEAEPRDREPTELHGCNLELCRMDRAWISGAPDVGSTETGRSNHGPFREIEVSCRAASPNGQV
ncbi:hypothetical protein GGTG_00855 [Gaeumannomyces tritici R3-111a-1]|uniref:Uncharacterized protein n=1 Tax=Gaeumannomyces tritici (strain R3-111a-1) TaxID=644352 RepID=J3NHW9_GAET3|nr:hypothetical protein GGTG_00855 [Gaeumannomyces tritici R3-111a-1]EJT80862.1 hypothetical protein GGTG_00855 [Gaeumannomyces tritici R3-111a-1]